MPMKRQAKGARGFKTEEWLADFLRQYLGIISQRVDPK
jgi:hypothetical protein